VATEVPPELPEQLATSPSNENSQIRTQQDPARTNPDTRTLPENLTAPELRGKFIFLEKYHKYF
jgi:hypothetical protein